MVFMLFFICVKGILGGRYIYGVVDVECEFFFVPGASCLCGE